jgi:Tol biopolymer transport system component
MTMSGTLQAEDRVAHYRVVGPLGAGGMGEVYLAQDLTLERNVALKVLPPQLVRSEDRVRRFVQEAKSASSLNHPNIITIYEIGQEPVKSGSGEVSSDPVRYISMELVSGRTLSTKIHEENTDLRTLLGYLAQAAEGIAKAHAAGIVHRDLKPGNIMVTDDGFAKVLDFGLAKLTERHGPEAGATATALTATAEQTAEGSILGTVHYMSPEQVRGTTVDHRSDVFSFGCILYEAATRRRPFSGASHVETMHQILHDRPASIEEFNAAVPNELRRLIRRCLQKSPDQRLQSMKDLAIELREIVEEFDELSISGTTEGSGIGLAAPVARRRSYLLPVIAIGAVLIAAAAYFGLRGGGGAPGEAAPSFQGTRLSTVTRQGRVTASAISRDGRYLAYVGQEAEGSTVFVRQVATGADVQVIAETDRPIGSLEFSPDGNYLFYTTISSDAPRYRTLYRIPSLGGQPEQRAFDVDSSVAFSPDGTQMAFVRYDREGTGTIQLMPASGGEAHELIRFASPERLFNDLSWSPDGRALAATVFLPPPSAQTSVALIDVRSGARTDVLKRKPAYLQGIAWTPDGGGLIVTGVDPRWGFQNQVFRVSSPGGELRRVTNDLNSYFQPSVSETGELSVIRTSMQPDLWSVDPKGGKAEVLVRSTSVDTAPTVGAVAKDAVVYVQPWGDGHRLYAETVGGGSPRIIPTGDRLIAKVACGGESIFFQSLDLESRNMSLWMVGLDGTGLHRLAEGSANLMDVSADGRYVAYVFYSDDTVLWILPTVSGTPHRLAENIPGLNSLVVFSPDGTRLLVGLNDSSGELVRTVYKVFPVDGEGAPQVLAIPGNGTALQWIPDDDAIAYVDTRDPARNLWRLPLDDGEPSWLTAFTEGQRVATRFSPDGRSLAAAVRSEAGDNLWLVDRNSLEARQITTFSGKTVFWWDWLGDGSAIMVAAGQLARDVVLIRDFQ